MKKSFYYKVVAFIGGMTIMAIEMTAVRIIGPYFGSSIFVWTNIIGMIMVSLAIGYWLGGRTADKHPNKKVFYSLLLSTSIIVLLIPFIAEPLLATISKNMSSSVTSLVLMSLLANAALFLIPFVMMGMISPYLIRLANKEIKNTGKIAGSIFAVSTVGSILGTFLPTLLTIPWIGVKKTILTFATILCLTAAIGLVKKSTYVLPVIFLTITLLVSPNLVSHPQTIAQTDSSYNYISVWKDSSHGTRMSFSNLNLTQSLERPNSVLTGGHYWDYFSLLPPLACEKDCEIAVIGTAAGTIPRIIDHYYSQDYKLKIDGIEIDPEVTRMAREYFTYDNPSLTTHHVDGRIFLQNSQKKYDIIILDAFDEIEIPPHLSSQEFFTIAKNSLEKNGVIAINIATPDPELETYQRFLATLQTEFVQTWHLNIPTSYNYLTIASNTDKDLPALLEKNTPDSDLRSIFAYSKHNLEKQKLAEEKPITDDLPLTEFLYDQMLFHEQLFN